jgi:chromosome partitioning protein
LPLGSRSGHRVCLLEADPLGTVSNWRRRRTAAEPAVETIHDGYALFHRVQALAHAGVTVTIIDTPGGWSDASRGAMAAADFCLIPARPSPADIEAAAPTLAAVRESRKPFAFVLTTHCNYIGSIAAAVQFRPQGDYRMTT